MLIVFFLMLLIGLAGFAFVFTKALKNRAVPEPLPLGSLERMPRPASLELAPPPLVLSADEPAQVVELKALCEAGRLRVLKLEQMIDEKNSIIADLQKNSSSGYDHQEQVDGLKQILQAQIDELKGQNKQLKGEVERLSGENLDLQTKVYAGQAPRPPAVEHIEIHPAALTAAEPPKEHTGNAQVNSLSLHDVFGGEEEKNS